MVGPEMVMVPCERHLSPLGRFTFLLVFVSSKVVPKRTKNDPLEGRTLLKNRLATEKCENTQIATPPMVFFDF